MHLVSARCILTTTPAMLRRFLSTTAAAAAGSGGNRPKPASRSVPNDDYFATVNHISNIVPRDIYMEPTLNNNKTHLPPSFVNSELVYHILISCSSSGAESFRFFNWARTHHHQYNPTALEFEELLKTLAKARHWETMWKVMRQFQSCFDSNTGPTFSLHYPTVWQEWPD